MANSLNQKPEDGDNVREMEWHLPFELEAYPIANSTWPQNGKHILATYTDTSIIVYQAYKESIGKWVVENQSFKGCPGYSMERMTWVKPNFLWMMYRSDWGTKADQERILAISISRKGFMQLLKLCKRKDTDKSFMEMACDNQNDKQEDCSQEMDKDVGENDVRIQWDPDHDPFGGKVERRAIQLGIRGQTLRRLWEEWMVSVEDITEFVKSQHCFVRKNELDLLNVPRQMVFEIGDVKLRAHVFGAE